MNTDEQKTAAKCSVTRADLCRVYGSHYLNLDVLPKPTRFVKMLFGNPTDFAIEAMTEPHLSAPSALWGRMRVVCDKQIYGDYENPHCALYPAYCQFRWFRENVADLWDSSFNGLSNSELHDLLDHAI